jgi:septal ring-binding cell division protein DamX
MTTPGPVFTKAMIYRNISEQFRMLAELEGTEKSSAVADTLNAEAAATAKREKAKTDKPAKAKTEEKVEKPAAQEEAAAPAPEVVAADLKNKLVALSTKNRAEAIRIVGIYGAKKFSEIPVEKHAEALRAVEAALNPAKAEDDLLA